MYCLIDSRDSTATARMPFLPASAALTPLLMFGALLTLPAAEENSNRDKTGTLGWSAPNAMSQSEKSHSLTADGSFEAERAGFEPAVGFDPYAALAKRCYRPLSHLSKDFLFQPLRQP